MPAKKMAPPISLNKYRLTFPLPTPEERQTIPLELIRELRQQMAGQLVHRLELLEILLGPDLAWKLLCANAVNRTLDPRTVTKYAHAMQEGEWVMNGQCILLTADGAMTDGQHRCAAVIQADVTVPMGLIIGVEIEDYTKIDLGKVRTPRSTVEILGMDRAGDVSAAAKHLWQVEAKVLGSAYVKDIPSSTKIRTLLSLHKDLPDSILPARVAFPVMVRSQAICLHYLVNRVDSVAATTFFNLLGNGGDMESTNPIHIIRERFIQRKLSGKPFYPVLETFFMVMSAWNDWRQGIPATKQSYRFRKGKPIILPTLM